MLSLMLSKDERGARLKKQRKKEKKHQRIVQLNDKDVFWSPYLQGKEARQMRVGVRDKGMGSGKAWGYGKGKVLSPHNAKVFVQPL